MLEKDRLFKYRWAHLPSGETGERTAAFRDHRGFLEELSKWNTQPMNKDWMYGPIEFVGFNLSTH